MIDTCGVRAWLLPAGEPFTIRNYYGGYTFSAEFRALFAARYQPEDSQSTPVRQMGLPQSALRQLSRHWPVTDRSRPNAQLARKKRGNSSADGRKLRLRA